MIQKSALAFMYVTSEPQTKNWNGPLIVSYITVIITMTLSIIWARKQCLNNPILHNHRNIITMHSKKYLSLTHKQINTERKILFFKFSSFTSHDDKWTDTCPKKKVLNIYHNHSSYLAACLLCVQCNGRIHTASVNNGTYCIYSVCIQRLSSKTVVTVRRTFYKNI